MKLKQILLAAGGTLLLGLAVLAGCSKEPMAPARAVALSVTMNPKDNVQAALLGSAENEIYWRVDGKGEPGQHFTYGPFSMPVSAGSVSFTVNVPQGNGPQVLSLQLNNASTHQPLAVGATSFDFGTGLEGGLVVDMGSVTRTCYYVNTDNPPSGSANLYGKGYSFLFQTDAVNAAVTDLAVAECAACTPANAFYFLGPLGPAAGPPVTISNIAYLGNGDLVDFDSVPPATSFYPTSLAAKPGGAPFQVGDIYCIQLQTSGGGYAWVQITDVGNPNSWGPAFIYRINTTYPYYAYQQTSADLDNTCTSY
jgi:hypothetical protein